MGFDTSGAKGRNKDVRKCGLLVSPDFLKRFLPSASPRRSDNHLFSSSTTQIFYLESLISWVSQIIISFRLYFCLATHLISWSSQPLLSSAWWSFPNQPLFLVRITSPPLFYRKVFISVNDPRVEKILFPLTHHTGANSPEGSMARIGSACWRMTMLFSKQF